MFHLVSYSSKNFPEVLLGQKKLDKDVKNYTSVLIGENGSGKTRLVNEIISSTRALHSSTLKKSINLSKSKIQLCGEINNLNKIVAISTSFNDKLPFSDNDKFHDDYYQYCGIRETSNASWTSSLMRKTLENLLVCIEDNKSQKIKSIFDFLGLSNKVRVTFSTKRKNHIDLENCSDKKLVDYVQSYYKNTSRMQVEKIGDFDYTSARSIIENFIPLIKTEYNKEKYIDVKISNKTEGVSLAFEHLDILRRVGIIDNVRLSLSRKDKHLDYTFINASSGEAQLLFSMSAFLRYVSDNCLVIIDEPEISLHPNWQIKYFSLLNLILDKVEGCHIIIATHSHFLVSELNPKSSSLVSLKNNNGIVEAENILSSTLGWSPESILYRVFNVRTFNSTYLESDLQKAHSMLYSDDCDFKQLEKLNKKFRSLVLDDADPLNQFIETVDGYLNEHK
ncbi:AAA family ATPase [Vibrio alginolyticus]